MTVLVTGSTSGIGLATAERMASIGATVVMVARDRVRGEQTAEEIRKEGDAKVDLLVCDLSSQASIRSAATELASRHDRLHVLINSAAVFLSSRQTTINGHEMMFATNHLGPFLLTNLLVPLLEKGAPSRIITVTAPSTTEPDIDDLQGERHFSPLRAFGASKAANLLFTYALARRVKDRGITANAFHPGGVVRGTRLMANAPVPMRIFSGILSLFAIAPERVAEDLIELATSEKLAGVTGQLLRRGGPMKGPFVDDVSLQEQLWAISIRLVGLEA
jgi:NAD(P)-dependent dehydrogenase (short-subunit alcohol dehydrogenase family)